MGLHQPEARQQAQGWRRGPRSRRQRRPALRVLTRRRLCSGHHPRTGQPTACTADSGTLTQGSHTLCPGPAPRPACACRHRWPKEPRPPPCGAVKRPRPGFGTPGTQPLPLCTVVLSAARVCCVHAATHRCERSFCTLMGRYWFFQQTVLDTCGICKAGVGRSQVLLVCSFDHLSSTQLGVMNIRRASRRANSKVFVQQLLFPPRPRTRM